jgi:DNA-binding NarL/FixJ family response regulator
VVSRRKAIALVNDFEIVLRGLARMLDHSAIGCGSSSSTSIRNPRRRVDIALFDTYGHPRNGIDRVRSLTGDPRVGAVAVYTWAITNEQVDAVMAPGDPRFRRVRSAG